MKRNISEFFRRGLMACGFGPVVLAVLYLVLQDQGVITTLTADLVSLGIFSLQEQQVRNGLTLAIKTPSFYLLL